MHNWPKHGVFLITGVMASGKSTIAQLLAERFDRGVHLRGDLFRRMIVSGREEMLPTPSPEALRQLDLRYRLAAVAADRYAEACFTVALQDVILGPDLSRVVDMLQTCPLCVIVLAREPQAVSAREADRPKKGYGEWSVEVNNLTVWALHRVRAA